ncbi:MAG: FecR domain-containing protein [Prevotella sp.]|jgi:hypothetical protein|nr:FecR domain-containing protein [Prevotella sp.]
MMTIEEIYKKYTSYSVEDLLQDDCFISSITCPTQESDIFWSEILKLGILDTKNYELACYFIRSVQVNSEYIGCEEIDNLWGNIKLLNKNNLKKRKNRFLFCFSAVAGIAALFVFLFVINYQTKLSPVEAYIFNIENVKPPDMSETDIQLVLAENEILLLKGMEAEIIYHKEGIAINNQKAELKNRQSHIVLNQLIVPLGKRSMLIFAEGSRMWVNAGTRVVYPSVFDKRQREIYVDGEVYLEVSPDANYPFVVRTRNLNVEVLGTSFNVMAYEKDTVKSIVLASGSVKIHSDDKKDIILSPNEMYSYYKGAFSEVKIVDAENYITWKSGVYQYESETLGVIMKRLSRYYGKDIVCSPQASQLRCSGKLDLKENLQSVLNGISQTAPVVCSYDGERYVVMNK